MWGKRSGCVARAERHARLVRDIRLVETSLATESNGWSIGKFPLWEIATCRTVDRFASIDALGDGASMACLTDGTFEWSDSGGEIEAVLLRDSMGFAARKWTGALA